MRYIKIFEGFKDNLEDMSLDQMMDHKPSYKDKVRNCLYDIRMQESSISEKDFSRLDLLDDQLESFYETCKDQLDEIINEFESEHRRPQYCAEHIYANFQF